MRRMHSQIPGRAALVVRVFLVSAREVSYKVENHLAIVLCLELATHRVVQILRGDAGTNARVLGAVMVAIP